MQPDHLLEQADDLLARDRRGPTRQADKRRAISAAYYAVFHTVLQAMADGLVGRGERRSWRYEIAYRSIDHKRLRATCALALSQRWPEKYRPLDVSLRRFCEIFPDLAELRNKADYNPRFRLSLVAAREAIDEARAAIAAFQGSDPVQQEAFLTYLAFQHRG